MADQPPNPANPSLNIRLPPPSHANVTYIPRSSSIADDSDAEFDPTPVSSPGGPQYDDLPPSYDEAQHQAVSDARNGIAPLDPNQLEAHRLTLNEGPNEPEVWEYRVRGEQPEPASEHELAPEYGSHMNRSGPTVPIQHIESSSDIPVGQVGGRQTPSITVPRPTAALLERALEFTRHDPDTDVQYAPRLTRCIALPQEGLPVQGRTCERRSKARGRRSSVEQQLPGSITASSEPPHISSDDSHESVQFLRAYTKALHTHSIRPAEFTEFLDGLNALCKATNTIDGDLVRKSSPADPSSSLVHDYIRGANEAFFAPRGLRVSLQSLSTLLEALNIPTERGQRAGAIASVLDISSTPARRAQALYPWIEALETSVPEPSTHTLVLRGMSDRIRSQSNSTYGSSKDAANKTSSDKSHSRTSAEEHADPPHSIPNSVEDTNQTFNSRGPDRRGFGGRGGRRGGPWTPFGAPGHGPFGASGNGPFGRPGRGPFGAVGNGPFGRSNDASFGSPGSGPGGLPHYGRGRNGSRSSGLGSSSYANEWAAWGENIGKLGEEFGKRMGDLGQQFGKRAEAWGQDVGRRAEVWGEEVSARASGSGTRSRMEPGPADAQVHDDPPPSYPEGPVGQEMGVVRGDSKTDTSISSLTQNQSKKNNKDMDDDDDDASSISSDASDSDSDSDSDSEDYPDTEAIFLERIRSINEQADLAAKKGKKAPEEVAYERAIAIEKAQNEKTAMDIKVEEKQTKRAIKLSLRQKGRELKRAHRQRKRELRNHYVGKGKGKAKKTKEWREAKREYREKKKELRREKIAARKEWREARYDRRKTKRGGGVGDGELKDARDSMVWLVIQNLGA